MLKKKYYDGFTVHDILNKHLDDGHKILELLTAFADADGVDAVEVVRCKDCKYWNYEDSGTDGTAQGACSSMCILSDGMFYCAGAERKEE